MGEGDVDTESNPYLELTARFNEGRIRAIICSGQAVVLHGLAVMSKDGDWILREDEEALGYILSVLDDCGASYRFGAPLALPWMRMGWSSHFEFKKADLRVRVDLFTRPPRITLDELGALWSRVESEAPEYPVTDLHNLARLKLTNRERDYAVLGEIARKFERVEDQMIWSRSARDLIGLARDHPQEARTLEQRRHLLQLAITGDRDALEAALDRERRKFMRANEQRLEAMQALMEPWRQSWSRLQKAIKGLSLLEAHHVIVEEAHELLPAG